MGSGPNIKKKKMTIPWHKCCRKKLNRNETNKKNTIKRKQNLINFFFLPKRAGEFKNSFNKTSFSF